MSSIPPIPKLAFHTNISVQQTHCNLTTSGACTCVFLSVLRISWHQLIWTAFSISEMMMDNTKRWKCFIYKVWLVQVWLRTEVLHTSSSTQPRFKRMTSRSWQYISCHWDACSNHFVISDFQTPFISALSIPLGSHHKAWSTGISHLLNDFFTSFFLFSVLFWEKCLQLRRKHMSNALLSILKTWVSWLGVGGWSLSVSLLFNDSWSQYMYEHLVACMTVLLSVLAQHWWFRHQVSSKMDSLVIANGHFNLP